MNTNQKILTQLSAKAPIVVKDVRRQKPLFKTSQVNRSLILKNSILRVKRTILKSVCAKSPSLIPLSAAPMKIRC